MDLGYVVYAVFTLAFVFYVTYSLDKLKQKDDKLNHDSEKDYAELSDYAVMMKQDSNLYWKIKDFEEAGIIQVVVDSETKLTTIYLYDTPVLQCEIETFLGFRDDTEDALYVKVLDYKTDAFVTPEKVEKIRIYIESYSVSYSMARYIKRRLETLDQIKYFDRKDD